MLFSNLTTTVISALVRPFTHDSDDNITVPLAFEVADDPVIEVGDWVCIRAGERGESFWWGQVLRVCEHGYSVGQLAHCGKAWFLPKYFTRIFVLNGEVEGVWK